MIRAIVVLTKREVGMWSAERGMRCRGGIRLFRVPRSAFRISLSLRSAPLDTLNGLRQNRAACYFRPLLQSQ